MNRGWLIGVVAFAALFLILMVAFNFLGFILTLIFKYWYIVLILIGVWFLVRLFRKRPEDKGIYQDSRGKYIETEYRVEEDDAAKKK